MKAGSVELQEVEIIGRKETTYQNEVSFVASKTATALRDVPQAVSYVTKEVSLKSRVSGRVISGVGDRRR